MKKILRNRFVRAFLLLIAFVFTGIVLAYSITSYLGRREWAAAKKGLEARGEKLSYPDFVPPPLADELNFFSAPAFAELTDYKLVESGGVESTEFRVPEARQQLTLVKTAVGVPFQKTKRLPNELTDLATAAAYYRTEGRAVNGERPPAEIVLEALEPARATMEEIARYAERPGARFPIRYEDGINAAMPHIGPFIQMSRYLSLRAVAEMELARGADALQDVLLMFRLADTLRNEPTLISLLVRISVLTTANQTVWEGVVRGAWDDSQLAALEERLRGYDLFPEIANALRAERANMLYLLETALQKAELAKLISTVTVMGSSGAETKDSLGAFVITNLYPKGLIYSDLAFFAGVHQRWIDAVEKRQGPIRPADFDFVQSERAKWDFPTKLKHVLSALALPSVVSVVEKGSALQSGLDETRTALALERCRLAHGEYPETLDALVPEFLKAVPLDVMTNKPLSYRRISPNDFLLWSVGWDVVDDGGKPLDPKTKKGDIVWMRLPKSGKPQ
jgi:hypothetical protein